ncbi:hypothetical protein RF11_01597 [Thelohanellus kitauei]|uniref:Uncharacterized protein n=1 Tax=Thelohanellus kitauei TaxID=669202 RepID=A0A0C2N5W7_THEKT|nr:hypothetical protein RF11_01597 [Thelohanellus kitauei]
MKQMYMLIGLEDKTNTKEMVKNKIKKSSEYSPDELSNNKNGPFKEYLSETFINNERESLQHKKRDSTTNMITSRETNHINNSVMIIFKLDSSHYDMIESTKNIRNFGREHTTNINRDQLRNTFIDLSEYTLPLSSADKSNNLNKTTIENPSTEHSTYRTVNPLMNITRHQGNYHIPRYEGGRPPGTLRNETRNASTRMTRSSQKFKVPDSLKRPPGGTRRSQPIESTTEIRSVPNDYMTDSSGNLLRHTSMYISGYTMPLNTAYKSINHKNLAIENPSTEHSTYRTVNPLMNITRHQGNYHIPRYEGGRPPGTLRNETRNASTRMTRSSQKFKVPDSLKRPPGGTRRSQPIESTTEIRSVPNDYMTDSSGNLLRHTSMYISGYTMPLNTAYKSINHKNLAIENPSTEHSTYRTVNPLMNITRHQGNYHIPRYEGGRPPGTLRNETRNASTRMTRSSQKFKVPDSLKRPPGGTRRSQPIESTTEIRSVPNDYMTDSSGNLLRHTSMYISGYTMPLNTAYKSINHKNLAIENPSTEHSTYRTVNPLMNITRHQGNYHIPRYEGGRPPGTLRNETRNASTRMTRSSQKFKVPDSLKRPPGGTRRSQPIESTTEIRSVPNDYMTDSSGNLLRHTSMYISGYTMPLNTAYKSINHKNLAIENPSTEHSTYRTVNPLMNITRHQGNYHIPRYEGGRPPGTLRNETRNASTRMTRSSQKFKVPDSLKRPPGGTRRSQPIESTTEIRSVPNDYMTDSSGNLLRHTSMYISGYTMPLNTAYKSINHKNLAIENPSTEHSTYRTVNPLMNITRHQGNYHIPRYEGGRPPGTLRNETRNASTRMTRSSQKFKVPDSLKRPPGGTRRSQPIESTTEIRSVPNDYMTDSSGNLLRHTSMYISGYTMPLNTAYKSINHKNLAIENPSTEHSTYRTVNPLMNITRHQGNYHIPRYEGGRPPGTLRNETRNASTRMTRSSQKFKVPDSLKRPPGGTRRSQPIESTTEIRSVPNDYMTDSSGNLLRHTSMYISGYTMPLNTAYKSINHKNLAIENPSTEHSTYRTVNPLMNITRHQGNYHIPRYEGGRPPGTLRNETRNASTRQDVLDDIYSCPILIDRFPPLCLVHRW